MIKKALIIGFIGFIVVFGLLFAQNFFTSANAKEGKRSDEFISQWKDKASLLGKILAESVSDEDEIVTSILLNQVKKNLKGAKYITVITNDGTILADLDTTKVGETYTGHRITGNVSRVSSRGNILEIGVPVVFGEEKVGEIYIGLDMEKMNKEKRANNTFINNLILSAGAFVLLFLIGIPLTKGASSRQIDVSTGLETLNEEMEKLKEAVNKLREEETSLTESLDEKRKELSDLENQIQQRQEDMKSIDEEWKNIGEKRMQVEELKAELSKLTIELDEKRKELEDVKKGITEGRAAVASAKTEEEALLDSLVGENNIDARIEEKKRQEVELTQRIVAKRREEIALSARVEAKRKELIELERKIEELKGKENG